MYIYIYGTPPPPMNLPSFRIHWCVCVVYKNNICDEHTLKLIAADVPCSQAAQTSDVSGAKARLDSDIPGKWSAVPSCPNPLELNI